MNLQNGKILNKIREEKPMKRLSLYLFLILFTLQTPSQADDIRDFQIEGMSIGDSLLDHLSKKEISYEINESSNTFFYKQNKFVAIHVPGSQNSETYDHVGVTIKPNDKKYIIHEIKGYLNFPNKLEDCLKKRDSIDSELSEVFKEAERTSDTISHAFDKSGKSRQYSVWYTFDTGFIEITCHDWSKKITKKNNWPDTLQVNIDSKEFENFINNEAF